MSASATAWTLAGLALIGATAAAKPIPRLAFNPSASMPRGWYAVTPIGGRLSVGDLVLAWAPKGARRLADRRGYLPASVPLLKPVAAVGGATICRRGRWVAIDGQAAAAAVDRDRAARPLPVWRGCRALATGEVLLLATNRADSFDGRYFGPSRTGDLIARATPIWTW